MAGLLDQYGRPIRRSALRGERAAPTRTGVRSVQAGSRSLGTITPARLAEILRKAETPGYGAAEDYVELAEIMEERDPHYFGVVQTRRRQVAQLGVTIEPASDAASDVADADLVRRYFAREELEDELYDLLDAISKGWAIAEIIWDVSASQWMPARLVHRLPQWFDWDADSGTRLQLRDEGGWSDLPPWKFVVHAPQAKSGLPIRSGLARVAAWTWLFKNLAVKDWARFCEAYGHPIRVGRFPASASADDRATLYRAVQQIAADAAAILPEGMTIDFVGDVQARGRSEIFGDLIAYLDAQISVAVLGQTLTTQGSDGGSGSYALGQVHDRVRRDIERSDARQLAATLRRDLVIPMVSLNHGPRDAWPRVLIERKDPADVALVSQALERLVPLGLRVRADDARSMLGLEAPGDDDDVLAPPDAGPPAMARLRPTDRIARARARADGGERAGLVQVLEAIDAGEWQVMAASVIRPVLDLARSAPEGFMSQVAEIWPEMSGDDLEEWLVRALYVSDLWGRATAAPP